MDPEAVLKALEESLAKSSRKSGGQHSTPDDKAPPAAGPPSLETELARIEQLITLADQGDAEAAQAVRNYLADDSAAWRQIGDLGNIARKALATALSGKSQVLSISVDRQMQAQLASLIDKDDSPLERMMIDRVVVAWAFAHAVDFIAATSGEAMLSPSVTKAQETAEKRCQAALKSLQLAREISRGAAGRPLRLIVPDGSDHRPRAKEHAAG